jgi:ATP phosphoribosyltransferase regulatory subunit
VLDTPSLRLPAGMRDFAPRAAAARRRIAETLLGVFESWGYARVITPAFEYEDVLGLGLGPEARAEALRFVEPSSGRVVALRPDFTPQVARLVATRFRDESGPLRLCYEGTVLRLERGARSQRELIQAGVELAGVGGPHGDADVIALGAAALAAAGLAAPALELTVDLGHLGLMREILAALELGAEGERAVRAAIAKRDPAGLGAALDGARAGKAVLAFVRALPELAGAPESVLPRAARQAPSEAIRRAIGDLQAIVDAVVERAPPVRLHVDLAEVRGFDYYTGVRFQAFALGSADPVLQGGRYDDLLGRYGRRSPAVGFAIDVEAAAAVLEASAGPARAPATDGATTGASAGSVLVIGAPAAAAARAAELRARGQLAAPLLVSMGRSEAEAYGVRWGYREVIDAGGGGPEGSSPAAAAKQKTKEKTNKRGAPLRPAGHANQTRTRKA